jgi:hypothetical protein
MYKYNRQRRAIDRPSSSLSRRAPRQLIVLFLQQPDQSGNRVNTRRCNPIAQSLHATTNRAPESTTSHAANPSLATKAAPHEDFAATIPASLSTRPCLLIPSLPKALLPAVTPLTTGMQTQSATLPTKLKPSTTVIYTSADTRRHGSPVLDHGVSLAHLFPSSTR